MAGVDLNSTERFQTKQQLLHRIQEGISFGDGVEYSPSEYLKVASERSSAWKRNHYPNHDVLPTESMSGEQPMPSIDSEGRTFFNNQRFTIENIECDYWDIVEKSKEVIVEYGNDVDTQIFGSGFPLSERGRALNGTKKLEKMEQPEPKFNQGDYYKETWWNLNNIPSAPGSVLRHVRVPITGISKYFLAVCLHSSRANQLTGILIAHFHFWKMYPGCIMARFSPHFVGTMKITIYIALIIIIVEPLKCGMVFLAPKNSPMVSKRFSRAFCR
jgi:hypothetical protein